MSASTEWFYSFRRNLQQLSGVYSVRILFFQFIQRGQPVLPGGAAGDSLGQ